MDLTDLSLDKKVNLIWNVMDYLGCFKEVMHEYYVNNYLYDDIDLRKDEKYADEILQDMIENEIIDLDDLPDEYLQ